jgi:thiol-disulfide isomerase/thioredoxin
MRTFKTTSLVAVACLVASLALHIPARAADNPLVGQPFPHFKHVDLGGTMIDTKQYAAGKTLLLDFWSIYCTSCIQEMPFIIKIYEKYKDKGLVALSMDMDAFAPKRVIKFIDGLDFKIPYPTIMDDKREIGALLKVSMLPTVILVDPQGKVILYHVGYKPGWENELDKIVKDALPKK